MIYCLASAVAHLRASDDRDAAIAAERLAAEPCPETVAAAIAIATKYAPRALHSLGVCLAALTREESPVGPVGG